ncbi:MAG: phenylalanine--tRNA ligase subunit alpha [Planctomycetaceae bacterium]
MSDTTADIVQRAAALAEAAVAALESASTPAELESARVRHLGKKSEIEGLSRGMKSVPAEDRKAVGKAINDAKTRVREMLAARKETVGGGRASPKDALDVTLPGIRTEIGRRHPLTATMEEIKSILIGMGFRYDDYPEVETEHYNFDALNTPDWHPARDEHDTFYTESGRVLRTHTTAFQNHAMQSLGPPPIRAMTSGRCYRCDTIDASHYPIFHQLDAIAIDHTTSFADLKWTLYELARGLFGDDVQLRFRPSFFPFTTPSAEVDVLFRGKWLEILGSGMIHPAVLEHGGLDPAVWQGFAFGLGVDRMAMIRHGIDDIRYLYENEEQFLRQF